MFLLRLAYVAEYLLAVIAVFALWSGVGGQSHLDLMPWFVKLVLGAGAAFATVKATAAAVSQERAWNAGSVKWFGILLALLLCCGLASYYAHTYLEDGDDQPDDNTAMTLRANPFGSAGEQMATDGYGYNSLSGVMGKSRTRFPVA